MLLILSNNVEVWRVCHNWWGKALVRNCGQLIILDLLNWMHHLFSAMFLCQLCLPLKCLYSTTIEKNNPLDY